MFNWIETQTLGRLSHDFNVFPFKPSPRSQRGVQGSIILLKFEVSANEFLSVLKRQKSVVTVKKIDFFKDLHTSFKCVIKVWRDESNGSLKSLPGKSSIFRLRNKKAI